MTTRSRIEWTEQTWNPVVGCTKISAGCKHCYAEVMARRLRAMGVQAYSDGFKLRLMPERLREPLERKKPTLYFVNSMSDLFHQSVPDEFVRQVFDVITAAAHHTFQVLTKRAERMSRFSNQYPIPENAWLGVSVENRRDGVPRIAHLQSARAHVRFLSIEPLIEDVGQLDLTDIEWAIVGGESGQGARPMSVDWVNSVRAQCQAQGVLFFFKQWGAFGPDGEKRSKKANGRELNGRVWNEMPLHV